MTRDAEKEELNRGGSKAYQSLLGSLSVKDWVLSLRLERDGSLPSIQELDYLADRRVTNCDVFSVSGDYGDYQNVSNQIRLMHTALKPRGMIDLVKDDSEYFLISRMRTTIENTADCMKGGSKVKKFILDSLTKEGSPLGSLLSSFEGKLGSSSNVEFGDLGPGSFDPRFN